LPSWIKQCSGCRLRYELNSETTLRI
jgi:hypothetical protein